MVADISASHGTIVGHVEKLGEIFGTEGWVLDRDDPSHVLRLELPAGGGFIAATTSGLDRPDVAHDRGVTARPGFRFDPSVRDDIAQVAAGDADRDFSICARGADMLLCSFARLESLEAVRLHTSKSRLLTTDVPHERLSQQADKMVAKAPRNDVVIHGALQARQPVPRRGTGGMANKAADLIHGLSSKRDDCARLAEPVTAAADPKLHRRLFDGIPNVLSSMQTAARYSSIVEGVSKAGAATRSTIVAYRV